MRTLRPSVRLVLSFACLLVTAPAVARGLFGGPGAEYETPTRFVRLDVSGSGGGYAHDTRYFWMASNWRGIKGTVILDRLRMGVALIDLYAASQWEFGWVGVTFVPLHVGYTIYSRPTKCWFFYGAIPDIYVEASAAVLRPDSKFNPTVRLAACAEIDYYGLGIGVEGGWVNLENTDEIRRRVPLFYLGLQIRVLTLRIGF
jgi:hypothetical protein